VTGIYFQCFFQGRITRQLVITRCPRHSQLHGCIASHIVSESQWKRWTGKRGRKLRFFTPEFSVLCFSAIRDTAAGGSAVPEKPRDSSFLQRAQCSHCKRCISYGNSVRMSVRPSVCPSVWKLSPRGAHHV